MPGIRKAIPNGGNLQQIRGGILLESKSMLLGNMEHSGECLSRGIPDGVLNFGKICLRREK